MAKSSSVFICQNCGSSFSKWQGKCDTCAEWNTLAEEFVQESKSHASLKLRRAGKIRDSLVNFSDVELVSGAESRFSTGIGELDRVLGGGLVPGAVILLGGEPGIGKSTLLTQVVINLLNSKSQITNSKQGSKPKLQNSKNYILYVAGEESPGQISLRIKRMLKGNKTSKSDKLTFCTSTNVDEVIAIIENKKPSLVIVDSIQTLHTDDLTGASGSVGQIRECTDRLTQVVKRLHIPAFLVGHVTKEGNIAGPKVLEHIVDAVLELSGERTGQLRILRAIKNRFGATDEVGVFQSVEWGMEEVANPAELF
ncbi:MAG: DNA repair protein RadA, partial [Patescibacteria group bacterium]